MDVLSVGGKDYVKASVIARDLGYTADYVGQLCRSGKVDAKLVGRSWYVDRDSLHEHRTNRYRSTQAKSVESLRETIEVARLSDEGSHAVPVRIGYTKTTGTRVKAPAYIAYSEDPADLIPVVSKEPVSIPVALADAKEVSITSASEKFVFETPEVPQIQFQGTLTVNNIEDEIVDEKGDRGRKLHPTWVLGKDKKKTKKLVNSAVTKQEESPLVQDKASSTHAVPTLQKNKTTYIGVEGNPQEGRMAVAIEEIEEGNAVSQWVFFASAAVSCALVLLTFCLELSITVADGEQTVSYSVALENLTASAYTAYEDFSRAIDIVEFSTNLFF